MPLQNYGIPDKQTAVEGMSSAAGAMQEAMRNIALPLATQLSQALQTAQAPEKYLEQYANRRLGRAAAQTQRLLNAASSLLPQPDMVPFNPLYAAGKSIKPPISPVSPTSPTCANTSGADLQVAFHAAFPQGQFVSGEYFFCWNPSVTPCQFYWQPYSPNVNCGPDFGGLFLAGMSKSAACIFQETLIGLGWKHVTDSMADPCGVTPPPPPPPPPECGTEGQPPCPPPPPPPPPPTVSPPPGSSCDNPIYMKICPEKKPAPGECTTDASGVTTCTPVPQPSFPTLPASGGGGNLYQCGLTADGQIPPIGSPEWCACIDELIVFFNGFGVASLSLIGITDPSQQQTQTQTLISQLLGPIFNIPIVGDAVSAAASVLSTVPQTVYTAILPVVQQIAGTTTALVGLAVARTIMRLLSNFRIGTDALLWATIDVDLTIPQVERIIDYVSDYLLPTEVPSIGDTIECYLLRTAPDELVKCWLLLHGANPDVWLPVMYARREKLQTGEVIEIMRRRGEDDDKILPALRNYGWLDEQEAINRLLLYDRLPERADFLHYLQRNVYDNDYVARYELLDGFEERYLANFGSQLHSLGITEEQSKLDYAAHWINAAPGELREFLYRNSPDMPGVENPFTLEDYERLLAEQDYAPWIRKRMVETAYRVPALGYLRDMYRQFVISDDDMKLYHRKLGYTVDDSERFVKIDSIIRNRIRASEGHGYTPSALAAAYSVGNIDSDGVIRQMDLLGFTDDEARRLMARAQSDFQRTIIVRARSRVMFSVLSTVKSALEAGAVDQTQAESAIQGLGWPAEFAQGWVSLQVQASNVKLIKSATSRIRSAFLSGEIDSPYVLESLQSIGLVPAAIQAFLATWAIEMTPRRKRRTAAQIVSDLALGELSQADALLRLTNLGYDDADKRLFLADAQRKLLSMEQRRLAAEQRTELTRARELQRLLREQKQAHKETLAEYKRISSPAKLQKWAKIGRIGKDLFYDRLRAQEIPDNDIGRYWDEACEAKNAACVDISPAPETPPSGLSGTGYPPDSHD